MARREVKILKYTKLGLAASVLSAVLALMALAVILREYVPSEGIIDAGTKTKPLIMGLILLCIAAGIPGWWLSLDGAANLKDKWRKLGWLGFWIGAGATMLGLILGVIFYFFKF